jgi:hypothetical protein
MANLLRRLTLQLGDGPTAAQFECQLNRAEITDEPTTSEVVTFCGTETFPTASYKLNLEGFQDWQDVAGICEIIHDAYRTDPIAELDFEVALGGDPDATPAVPPAAFRSGQCKPTSDVSFGGTAGDPLAFTQVLDIVGTPAETALA